VSEVDDTRRLTRYLLGQLPEGEAIALEDAYFKDEAVFARLEVAADDLAALYAVGGLSEDERGRFRTHLLGSRDDRLRVRVARALDTHARSLPAVPRPSFLGSIGAWLAFPAPSVRFAALAATVAMVAGGSYLSWRVVRLQSEVGDLRTALSGEQARSRTETGEAVAAAQRERALREAAERRVSDLATSSFVVLPGTDRGAGTDLSVPKRAELVRFDLALERPVSGQFRVIVRTADRAVVWSQNVDVPSPATTITVTVPAMLLPSAEYEVVLQSIAPDGSAREEGVYGFRIKRTS
jgi:hypothetical protein